MESSSSEGGRIIACKGCGLKTQVPTLAPNQTAYCSRCGHKLTRLKHNWVDKVLALSMSGLILLVLSISADFLSFATNGLETSISLVTEVETLINQSYLGLAGVILFVCILLPAVVLVLLCAWMISIKLGIGLRATQAQISLCFNFIVWCMPEVFMVGVLVSMVKITAMAEVTFGLGFYFYIGFMVLYILTLMYLDRYQVELELTKDESLQELETDTRKRVQWTWALLLTAVLLYLPANLLPIMTTRFLGADSPSTIVGGVITLWDHGSYFIATVIFVASILVPVFKMLAIGYLNYSVQTKSKASIKQRYILYRITEIMGRWSMIDVFVVAILAGLVQLGSTMSVYPGSAVIAFCAVVVLTMLAAMSFDSRMIWEHKH
ncbi:paraquat-inducible protein A [Marinomonas ostreistagni]|uniref:Paraquat-inducible protein A n=1 Tax=Marinomonas ostreistagni TaxID=359209 RepID=A0ABS0ZD10_9GAMM|nr:paraquat-inducible protein A [Marinomonas ostreistagni]MBJ7550836.1 paraquat-inducible protein A [Marinomonas ostreistagni]